MKDKNKEDKEKNLVRKEIEDMEENWEKKMLS